jgi:hypothetical protein
MKITFDNVAECLQELEKYDHRTDVVVWARPASWDGLGEAITNDRGTLEIVPQGVRAFRYAPSIKELTGKWQLVCSDTVLGELNEQYYHRFQEGR